jgi:dTDP-4-amino-4,6-dideoxygalactose transaminase
LYERARPLLGDPRRPAAAGGRPARLLPFPRPRPFGAAERRELRRAVNAQETSFSDGGTIHRFEAALRGAWGAEHALAVSSGTAALHTALMACGVGAGDEVIVPVLTHAATALAVLHQGARPRFVDVHPETWNLDPQGVAEVITPRTRAVIAVHLCGVPCEMGALGELTRAHGLVLIEDAAQSHGSTFDGRPTGLLGDVGCFSFQSTKAITSGEGGAVLTNDGELASRARLAMNLGERTSAGRATVDLEDFGPFERLDYTSVGWNYRMGALQAALGLGQLARRERLWARRRENARELWRRLQRVPELRRQGVPAGADPCPASLSVEFTGEAGAEERDQLARDLVREGVDFRMPYPVPLSSYKVFDSPGHFPNAERACRRTIGFRVDPEVRRSELRATAFAVERILAWRRRTR